MDVPDPPTPERLEQCRRSLVMLTRGEPSGLDRDAALALMGELQRLQARDRRFTELVEALRDLLASAADDQA